MSNVEAGEWWWPEIDGMSENIETIETTHLQRQGVWQNVQLDGFIQLEINNSEKLVIGHAKVFLYLKLQLL